MSNTYDDLVVIPSLKSRLISSSSSTQQRKYFSAPDIDLSIYDRCVIALSCGKDSIACVLRLKELGFDQAKIELWHHDVDGHEGSQLMDWVFMRDYNRKFAEQIGLPLYFSWLEGGFEGELLKDNGYSAPHKVETPDGLMVLARDHRRSRRATRLRFPQVSPSLQTRWCSSVLKIDVGRRALNNQDRFDGQRVLFVTGERREESSNRARYHQLEPHACDRRDGRKARQVDAWRPVLDLSEEDIWDMLQRHRVVPPVPYRLGWSRSSCMNCIYNGPVIWATIAHYFPERALEIARYENQFGVTISRKKIDVIAQGLSSQPLKISDLEALMQATSQEYFLPVFLPDGATWNMPAGAFGRVACGAN